MADKSFSIGAEAWDTFVASHAHGHVLQSSRWARLKSDFGWKAELIPLCGETGPDAPLSAGAVMLFRRLPWGQTLAYVPKGPLVNWSDPAAVASLLRLMRGVARRHRAALIKIEPEVPQSAGIERQLTEHGFRPGEQRVQPVSTIQVDLAAEPDAILARMKSKWRYNIRLAERKGVRVREGTLADLPQIQQLLEVTGQRDGFGVHSLAYYRRATELFGAAGQATWLVAEHEDQMLAAVAVFAFGAIACYMWGASSDEGRNLMPNHALQWAAMQWAKDRGCAVYDLWGIPDEVGDDPEKYTAPESWGSDGLWGVYRFKQGFGGQVVRYTGAWDLPVSGPGYHLYRLALRFRQRAMER